ncbi:MAG: SHOCT domain-containing protein [Oryzihumus sp.]
MPEQRTAAQAADPLDQLKKLGDLKAQGVLTEEEFAAQKAKILGS